MRESAEYTIGIIGLGFVGTAVASGFENYTKIVRVDEDKLGNQSSTIEDATKVSEAIFICLPTPSVVGGYDVDISIIDSVLKEIDNQSYRGIVIIKSSVTPQHLQDLYKKYSDLRLVFNPEFLTERNANDDFQNPFFQIFGGDLSDCHEAEALYDYYSCVKGAPVFKTDIITASLVKYALNSFYATKVTFMNELYHLHTNSNAASTWEEFAEILKTDPRMGNSHMSVPGPGGNFGFGGNCFPKDTKALLEYSESVLGVALQLLSKVVEENEKVRTDI